MSSRRCESYEHKHKPHKIFANTRQDAVEQQLNVHSSKQYPYICKICNRPLSPPSFVVSDKCIALSHVFAACLYAAVVVCMNWNAMYTLVDRRPIAMIAAVISFAITCVVVALVDAVTYLMGQWNELDIEAAKPYDIISQNQTVSYYASAYREKLINAIRSILISFFSLCAGKYVLIILCIIIPLTTIRCIRSSKWKLLSIPVLFIISTILLIITPGELLSPVLLLPGIIMSVWIYAVNIYL